MVERAQQVKRSSAVCRAADKESTAKKAEDFKCPVACTEDKEAEHQDAACTEMAKSKCVHPERTSGFCKDCPRK